MKYFNTSYANFEGTFKQAKSFIECYHDFGYTTLSIVADKYWFSYRYSVVVKKDNMISDQLHEILHWTPPHMRIQL